MERAKTNRVVILTELYYPESTSTGKILTRLAEGFATDVRVLAICGQPKYNPQDLPLPRNETHGGVDIHRCSGTRLDRNRLPSRIINAVTLSFSIALFLLFNLRRGDRVLMVTNPPLLPYLATIICGLRGIERHLLVHDVYPECLIATGLVKQSSWFCLLLHQISRWLYRSMDGIIAIGRDMRDLIEAKVGDTGPDVQLIPNWADEEYLVQRGNGGLSIRQSMGWIGKYLFVYAGNMGRTHDMDVLLRAAQALENDARVQFVVAGGGAKRQAFEDAVKRLKLTNVQLMGPLSDHQFLDLVTAADINLITFIPGMKGISVPSRAYNALATGTPILAVADPESELSRIIQERSVGWIVQPGDDAALLKTLRKAIAQPHLIARAGLAARTLAAAEFRFPHVLLQYKQQLFVQPNYTTPKRDAA